MQYSDQGVGDAEEFRKRRGEVHSRAHVWRQNEVAGLEAVNDSPPHWALGPALRSSVGRRLLIVDKLPIRLEFQGIARFGPDWRRWACL